MMRGIAWTVLALVGALLPAAGEASIVTGTGAGLVGGKSVSAQVDFEIVGGNLQITLTNTSTAHNYTLDQVLTGVSFNWKNPALDFIRSSSKVVVALGSKLYYDQNPNHFLPAVESNICDISAEWGLAKNVALTDDNGASLGVYQFSITSTKPIGLVQASQFANGNFSISNPAGLSGADFGLVNGWQSRMSGDIKDKIVIADSVVITLKPTIALTKLDLEGASFNFGYCTTDGAHRIVGVADDLVPEPASLAVWSVLGLCWAGVRCWRNRRDGGSPVADASWNSDGSDQRIVARPPWPAHVREAIIEIIERGCPHC